MNIEVGEYIRSVDGFIRKVTRVNEKGTYEGLCYGAYSLDVSYKNSIGISSKKVKSHSKNIIDLIEIGDLLKIKYYSPRYKERVTRLFEVSYKDSEFMTIKNAYCDFMLKNNEFNDKDKKLKPIIKSIVTKEQIEEMEYNV